MRAAEPNRLAERVGLDVVGAAPARPYEETERHIAERRARGLAITRRFGSWVVRDEPVPEDASGLASAVERYASDGDPVLRDAVRWALGRLAERSG
jgi:hypothetical protein